MRILPAVHSRLSALASARRVGRSSISPPVWLPEHRGSEFVQPALGKIRLNLGGEAGPFEPRGFICVNPLTSTLVDARTILDRDPTGALTQAGAESLPFPTGSVLEIYSRGLPSPVLAENAARIASEADRVLAQGGKAVIHSNTPFGSGVKAAFEERGFELEGRARAVLRKN